MFKSHSLRKHKTSDQSDDDMCECPKCGQMVHWSKMIYLQSVQDANVKGGYPDVCEKCYNELYSKGPSKTVDKKKNRFAFLKRIFRSKNPTPKQMRDAIKKDRIEKYGEVFTPEWLVKDMCNLLGEGENNDVWTRVDATFLEPSFGTGNFLVEILQRKMDFVFRTYGYDQRECERQLLIACDSIYGVELLEDNVKIAIERMMNKFKNRYETEFPNYDPRIEMMANNIFVKNLVCGDFLKKKDHYGNDIWFLKDTD